MAVINIHDGNLRSLRKIQKVVQIEEEVEISLDETLERVLAFYRKFVPYN